MNKSFHIKGSHTHTHTLPESAVRQLDIPIFAKIYEFYKLLTDYLTFFPKAKRYTLGQRIDLVTLAILELTIAAGYTSRAQKLPTLQKISFKLDLLKILLRLSWETRCIDHNKYQQLSSYLQEIGKMLGGWIKATR